MYRTLCLAVAVALFAAPALASDRCVGPYAPQMPDGATATKEQILTARDDAMDFMTKSDAYQECLLKSLKVEKGVAARDKKDFDPKIEQDYIAKVDANQAEKERVGAEFNESANAYNAAHPGN